MQTLYEVEWMSNLPEYPDLPGEADWDSATYEYQDFNDLKEAKKFAKKEALTKDVCGEVRIRPFHYELYEPGYTAKYKEYHDSEIIYIY